MRRLQISSSAVTGIGMLKSDIGGSLLFAGLSSLSFALSGTAEARRQWGKPCMLFSSCLGIVRASAIITDGYNPLAAFGVAVESTYVLMVWYVLRQDEKEDREKQQEEANPKEQ